MKHGSWRRYLDKLLAAPVQQGHPVIRSRAAGVLWPIALPHAVVPVTRQLVQGVGVVVEQGVQDVLDK